MTADDVRATEQRQSQWAAIAANRGFGSGNANFSTLFSELSGPKWAKFGKDIRFLLGFTLVAAMSNDGDTGLNGSKIRSKRTLFDTVQHLGERICQLFELIFKVQPTSQQEPCCLRSTSVKRFASSAEITRH